MNLYIKSTNNLECKNKYIRYGNFLNRLRQIKRRNTFITKYLASKGIPRDCGKFYMDTYTGKNDKNDIVKSLKVNVVEVTEKKKIGDHLN